MEKLQRDARRGAITIKSNSTPIGWVTHKLRTVIPKFSHCCQGSEGHLPAWGPGRGTENPQGIWPWRPVGFDYKTSIELGETDTLVLDGTKNPKSKKQKNNPRAHQDSEERSTDSLQRKLNQNYLLVLKGLLWRCRSAGAHHRDGDTGSSCLGRSPLVKTLLEITIIPTIEPKDPRAGWPQAKKLRGREHNPTHQWIIGLKLYRARPCPPEQDPAFPTTSPSHEEAYTSLLASFIRGQTEEARRSTIPQWLKQNHITES